MAPKLNATKRALLERLWASGVDTAEIARQMGWSDRSPASTYIAVYRERGWNLPPRDPERAKAIKRGRWPDKA